jgi:hypothetical protein
MNRKNQVNHDLRKSILQDHISLIIKNPKKNNFILISLRLNVSIPRTVNWQSSVRGEKEWGFGFVLLAEPPFRGKDQKEGTKHLMAWTAHQQ